MEVVAQESAQSPELPKIERPDESEVAPSAYHQTSVRLLSGATSAVHGLPPADIELIVVTVAR